MLHKIVKGYEDERRNWHTEGIPSETEQADLRVNSYGQVEKRIRKKSAEGYEALDTHWGTPEWGYRVLLGIKLDDKEVFEGDNIISRHGIHDLVYSDRTGFYFQTKDGSDILNIEDVEGCGEFEIGGNIYESIEKQKKDDTHAIKGYTHNKVTDIMMARKDTMYTTNLNNTLWCVEETVSFRSAREWADVTMFQLGEVEYEMTLEDINRLMEDAKIYKSEQMSDGHITEYLESHDYEGLQAKLEGCGVDGLEMIYYINDKRRHGVFFTKMACEDHIMRIGNGYHLPQCVPIYAEGEQEIEDVLNYLMAMTTGLSPSYLMPGPKAKENQ